MDYNLWIFFKRSIKKTKFGAFLKKMRKIRWKNKDFSVKKMHSMWNRLSKESRFGYISHLKEGAQWDIEEFQIVGSRFSDRIVERFVDYGKWEPENASLLEIGCGVGRFIKPMAGRFREVWGVDISEEMIAAAKDYCNGLSNVKLSINDGKSLKEFDDNCFEYCLSAGVFQHITHIDVILDYIREALRVLKPEGLFLFQFQGNLTEEVGRSDTGAKITAKILDSAMKDLPFAIREVSIDLNDPVRNIVVVVKKIVPDKDKEEINKTFAEWKMTERAWRSGVYDDIKTETQFHERQRRKADRLTFFD